MVPLTRKGVIERAGTCSIREAVTARRRNGGSIDRSAVPVARAARRFAGAKADLSTATAGGAPLCAVAWATGGGPGDWQNPAVS